MNRFTIYNASAGSGKTYTLAVEYIAKLLACDNERISNAYHEILAVTFTNKATSEMKDRILQQLYGIGAGLEDSNDYLESLEKAIHNMGISMERKEIQRRCAYALLCILHDYSYFRVETIDSFFRSVVSNMSRELGLPTGLKTDLDQGRAIRKAVDRIIDNLEQTDNVRRWISEFVSERLNDGERWNVDLLIKNFAIHLFDETYLENEEALTKFLSNDDAVNKLRDTHETLRKHIFASIEETLINIASIAPSDDSECGIPLPDVSFISNGRHMTSHIKNLINATRGGKWPDIGSSLEKWTTANNMLRSKHTPKDEELAQAMSGLITDMLELERFAQKQLNSIQLIRRNLNEMRLLNTVGREVNKVTQEHRTFLLANSPILLHNMMGKNDASFIYEKTGTFLRHVMLDEFQDTSSLQWSNFETLISENMAKGGTTLIVGDVKQSIYRWRGGDWKILSNLKNEMKRFEPHEEPLKINYRSERRIIEFNNHLYTNITEDINRLCRNGEKWSVDPIYQNVRQDIPNKRKDKGFVSVVDYIDGTQNEAHQAAIKEMCAIIKSLIYDYQYNQNDIAILIRRKEEMNIISTTFAELLPDVQLVSNDVFRLSQSSAVNIIIDALRVILHPDDKASLGRLIYMYNHEVRKQSDINLLFDNCDTNDQLSSLCHLLPARFKGLASLHRLPVFELIVTLSNIFEVNNIQGQSAYIMTFYDHITSSITDYASNLPTLLTYWDETLCNKSIPGGEVRGINIMTVHRAKGLQWKTVFIPFCDWRIHDSHHEGSLLWSCPAESSLLCGLPCAAIPIQSKAENSIFSDDYYKELQNQRVDNLNLLYVATTRAKQNLYLWGYGKENANPTMMQLIASTCFKGYNQNNKTTDQQQRFSVGEPVFVEDTKKGATDNKSTDTPNSNRLILKYNTIEAETKQFAPLINFRQSNEAAKFTGCTNEEVLTPQQSTYIDTGSVLHNIFASISTGNNIDHIINSLPISLVTTPNGVNLSKRAKQLLNEGLTNPIVADWFSGKYKLYNECSIMGYDKDGRAKEHRPDRVMIDNDCIIIVDFKFGTEKPKHKEQVANYIQLIKQIYPNHSITGYLWYVYQNKIITIP